MSLMLLAADETVQSQVVGWVAAVGSVGAALVPLIFFLVERRDRQRAEARRDEAEKQRNEAEERYRSEELERLRVQDAADAEVKKRAQADLVHAWVRATPDNDFAVFFNNASPVPVSDVKVAVSVGGRDARGYSVAFQEIFGLDMLPPTGGTPMIVPFKDLHRYGAKGYWPPAPDLVEGVATMVDFVDVNGRRWERRLPAGQLREV